MKSLARCVTALMLILFGMNGVVLFGSADTLVRASIQENKSDKKLPSQTVADYIRAVSKGDSTQARLYVAKKAKDFGEEHGLKALRDVWPETWRNQGFELVKIENEVVTGSDAVVVALTNFNSDRFTFRLEFTLRTEEGEWKIVDMVHRIRRVPSVPKIDSSPIRTT